MGIKAFSAMLLLTAAALPGCADQADTPKPVSETRQNLDDFIDMYGQNFQAVSKAPEDYFIERRVRIDNPHLAGTWFYTQINKDEDAKLYRQRVLNFTQTSDGKILQKAYRIKTPEALVGLWDNPDQIKALSMNDIEPYFKTGCDQVWEFKPDGVWHGLVDPRTCIIDSKRRGVQIRIETESRLSPQSYLTNERGYTMDNVFLWGSKPGTFMTLKHVP